MEFYLVLYIYTTHHMIPFYKHCGFYFRFMWLVMVSDTIYNFWNDYFNGFYTWAAYESQGLERILLKPQNSVSHP